MRQMPYLHHDGRCEPDYISLLASSKYMFQAGPHVGVSAESTLRAHERLMMT